LLGRFAHELHGLSTIRVALVVRAS
jgi:hypothetical protein